MQIYVKICIQNMQLYVKMCNLYANIFQNMQIKYAIICQNMDSMCINMQNMHKYATKICTICRNM